MIASQKKLAVVDLDGTLFKGQSQQLLISNLELLKIVDFPVYMNPIPATRKVAEVNNILVVYLDR